MGAIACHRRQLRASNCIASRMAGSQQRSSGGTFRPDTGSSLNIEIVLKRPLFFGRFGRGGAFPSARASSLIGVADLAVPLFAPATLDRRARLVDAPCHAGDVKAPLVAEAGARPWVRALVGTGSGTGRGGVQRLRVLGRPMPRDPRRANRWVAQGQRSVSLSHFAPALHRGPGGARLQGPGCCDLIGPAPPHLGQNLSLPAHFPRSAPKGPRGMGRPLRLGYDSEHKRT